MEYSDNTGKPVPKVHRPKILLFSEFYLPGYKSGGGMRSIVNMVDRLGSKYDFQIVTLNHDGALDTAPYQNVPIHSWTEVKGTPVYYTQPSSVAGRSILSLLYETKPAAVYTNSLFSAFTRTLVKLRRTNGSVPPLIIAPCGELNGQALQIKKLKKRAYLAAAKALNLYRDVIWKASTETERLAVLNLDPAADVLVAPDLLAKPQSVRGFSHSAPSKVPGTAKMAFISRIVPIKNLLWLIQLLRQGIEGSLDLTIYGPLEDKEYWATCEKAIADLPPDIRVAYNGPIPHERIARTLSEYQYFVLPSLSENFGHAIWEALAAGCPVITSDNTPWRDLSQKGIGWDLPLASSQDWQSAINECIGQDQHTYSAMNTRAQEFAYETANDPAAESMNAAVLESAISSGSRANAGAT